jgi:hypothetical protein
MRAAAVLGVFLAAAACASAEGLPQFYDRPGCVDTDGIRGCDVAQVTDEDHDGDLADDFQRIANSLLFPGGAPTSAPEVRLLAPRPGTYAWRRPVRLCGSNSLVTADVGPDCTGSSGLPATVVLDPSWDAVLLDCKLTTPGDVNWCLRIGDGWNDGLGSAASSSVRFEGRLRWILSTPIAGDNDTTALWADNVRGDVRLGCERVSGAGFSNCGWLIGNKARWDVDCTSADATECLVTMDGDQQGSTLTGRLAPGWASIGSLGVLSYPGHETNKTGGSDGCDYNGTTATCAGLTFLPDFYMATASRLYILEWDDLTIDGTIIGTNVAEPPVDFQGDDVAASGPALRAATVRGNITCQSLPNSCVRVHVGQGDDDTFQLEIPWRVTVDALVRRVDALSNFAVGCAGVLDPGYGTMLVGPNFHCRDANGTRFLQMAGGGVGVARPGARTGRIVGGGLAHRIVAPNVSWAGSPALGSGLCLSNTTPYTFTTCGGNNAKWSLPGGKALFWSELALSVGVTAGSGTGCALRARVGGVVADSDTVHLQPAAGNHIAFGSPGTGSAAFGYFPTRAPWAARTAGDRAALWVSDVVPASGSNYFEVRLEPPVDGSLSCVSGSCTCDTITNATIELEFLELAVE